MLLVSFLLGRDFYVAESQVLLRQALPRATNSSVILFCAAPAPCVRVRRVGNFVLGSSFSLSEDPESTGSAVRSVFRSWMTAQRQLFSSLPAFASSILLEGKAGTICARLILWRANFCSCDLTSVLTFPSFRLRQKKNQ